MGGDQKIVNFSIFCRNFQKSAGVSEWRKVFFHFSSKDWKSSLKSWTQKYKKDGKYENICNSYSKICAGKLDSRTLSKWAEV